MNQVEAFRNVIAVLTAQLALIEGKPPTTYLGQILPLFDTNEAERKRLEEIANSMKPHAWVDWVPGVPPDQVGDNDKPDDDFLRDFEPMMRHAGMAHNQFRDSKGEIFFYPNIKKRTGPGWMGVKRECLRMVMSEWGQAWMSHPDNIAAGNLVPKPAAVARLAAEVAAAV